MKILTFISILLTYGSLFAQPVNVIPLPRQITMQGKQLVWKGSPNIKTTDSSLQPLSKLLAGDIFRLTGLNVTADATGTGDIVLMIDHSVPRYEYRISISDRIILRGADYLTVTHATTTLLQLHSVDKNRLTFPKLEISDSPANEFRSLLVDVARQVIDIRTLKQSVELCRFYKIPYLQIHISDDQAFCFPSVRFPELATKGHSYTLEELNDLVAFAQVRGVAIIPELDGPGHSSAIRKANPEVFGSTAFSVLDLVSERMYQGMQVVLSEMISVFHTSPYFHIGADEAGLNDNFLNAPQVKAFMQAKGYSGDDLHRMYVARMDSIVKSLGKKTMAWESFKADNKPEKIRIPADILVNTWETLYELPQNYINNGYNIVNTSWKPYYTTRDKRWHPEFIYNFSKNSYANFWNNAPSYVPFDIPPSPQVKGGQMCVWEQLDAQTVQGVRNRIPAFSEYYWLEDDRPGYSDYARRFRYADQLFDKLLTACQVMIDGTYPVPDMQIPWHGEQLPNPNGVENNYQNWFEKEVILKVTPMIRNSTIYFTTDGSLPDTLSAVFPGILKITEDTHIRMITCSDSVTGYQQYVFEHRPVRASLTGIQKFDRDPEPYSYINQYVKSLTIQFEEIAVTGAEIRYTLDGTAPAGSSTLYDGPIEISSPGEYTIRACAFKDGQPFGKEWNPSDHFEFNKNYAKGRHYRFKVIDPDAKTN
jgi:hexosaminidase